MIRKFAEMYYHFFISHGILMKFQANIAQFNSTMLTNFYPNRAENKTVHMATSLQGTRPETF